MGMEVEMMEIGVAAPGPFPGALVRTHPYCPQVQHLVSRCTCPVQFPMIKISEGKYRVGDSDTLIFVRVSLLHPVFLEHGRQESCSAATNLLPESIPQMGPMWGFLTLIPKAGKLSPAVHVCMAVTIHVYGKKTCHPVPSQSQVLPSSGNTGMLRPCLGPSLSLAFPKGSAHDSRGVFFSKRLPTLLGVMKYSCRGGSGS